MEPGYFSLESSLENGTMADAVGPEEGSHATDRREIQIYLASRARDCFASSSRADNRGVPLVARIREFLVVLWN